jgi:hypothetical protein
MTYEAFKLAVIEMAIRGWQYYPHTSAALLTVWQQGHAGATSEEILRLAYIQYCRNHGIEEQP